MIETLTSYPSFQHCPNKAYPHLWKKDHFETIPFENLDAFLPAAGLFSSAHDMTLFLFFLLNQGTYHAKSVLSSSSLNQIFTPQTTATAEEFTGFASSAEILFPTLQFLNYGLGCFIHDYRGIQMIQVPGLTDGTSSVLALIPSLNLGIFITANAENVYFTRALLFQFIDSYLNQKTDWNIYFLKKQRINN